MLQQIGKIVLIIFVAVSLQACVGNRAELKSDNAEKPLPNEMNLKRSLLEKFLPPKAVPLKVEKSFTPNSDGVFVYPISLAISEDGQIYVSDNNGQAIHKVPSDLSTAARFSKENVEQDEKKLKYPNTIRFYNNKIFVADNDGIKVFKQNGELEKIIRTYYSINDFSIDSEGSFYVNANFLTASQENSLIIKLDENGTRIGGAGRRSNSAEDNDAEGIAYVEVKEPYIVVAYKHLPLVQIFDIKSRDLIREFEVKHPIFGELKKLKNNKEFANPKTGIFVLPRYFAGVKVFDNKIYLLLHFPYPEIIEVDSQGNELNRYRSEAIAAMNYFGFDVRSVGGARQFIVGVIEPLRAPTIAAFSPNTETKSKDQQEQKK